MARSAIKLGAATVAATNLGAGTGLYACIAPSNNINFKTLTSAGSIAISATATEIQISGGSGGGGEINTASNLGGGDGTYSTKVGSDLQFKSLVAAGNLSISNTSTEITISGGSGGSADGVVSGATLNSTTLELGRTEGLGDVTVNLSSLVTTPSLPSGSVQFNNGGVFGGDAEFNYVLATQSLTLGHRTGVAGVHSFSIGCSNIASGDYSFAQGCASCATGKWTTALGRLGKATGDYSHALGFNALASGLRSIGIGSSVYSTGSDSIAMGSQSRASGSTSMAVSRGCAFGAFSFAAGCCNAAWGSRSFTTGGNSAAFGINSIAMGCSVCACGNYSIAIGSLAVAFGQGSIVIGSSNQPTIKLHACGISATNMSRNNNSQTIGHGANADRSGIFGGSDHNIESGNANAAIVGGDTIKLTGNSYACTTAVGNLAIMLTPSAGGSNDLLTWETGSTGIGTVRKVTQASVSDERLKTIIKPIGNALEGVIVLNAYEYEFNELMQPKSMLGKKRYGLIAQEVEVNFPFVVNDNLEFDEITYKTVEYRELVPVLVQAIKELNMKVEDLKSLIK